MSATDDLFTLDPAANVLGSQSCYVGALTAAKSALEKYAEWHAAVSASQHDTPEQFMRRVRLLGEARIVADGAMTKINAALNPHNAEVRHGAKDADLD